MAFVRRHLKKLIAAAVLASLAVVAHAILPAFMVAWLISGSNLMIADIFVGSVGVIAGIGIWECETGRATTIQGCKDYRQPQATTGAPIVINLKPDAVRKNPDATKFDSPVSPARDVTPKASVASGAAKPGNGSLDAIARAAVGKATYADANGKLMEVDVIQTYQTGKTQAVADSEAQSNTAAAHSGWLWSRGYTVTSTDWRAVWYRSIDASCSAGYTLSGTTCILTNAAAVKKPAGTTCEALYYASSKSFQFDSANPECDGLAAQLISSSNPGKVAAKTTGPDGKQEGWTAEPSGDGWKICQDKGTASTQNCLYTGAYAPGQGGFPIEGSTSGSGGGLVGDGSGSGSGSQGTGGTSGTGGTGGTSSGDCAGYGCAKEATQLQVKTAIEDIIKPVDASAIAAAEAQFKSDSNAAAEALLTTTQGKFKTVSDYSGITSGITSALGFPAGGQCSNAVFNWSLFSRPMTVDFQWLCVPLAPIINWFFWMLVMFAGISEVLFILTGRGLPGEVGSVVAGHRT